MQYIYCCALKERQKTSFFSLFYMSINIGSLLSTIVTPYIRGKSVTVTIPGASSSKFNYLSCEL